MTKIIGLTGGIGSGKTTVAELFQQHGVPVYIADLEAKKLMDLPETLERIKKEFGTEIFTDSTLDRKKLANLVFNDSEKLKKLNAIVHPLVRKDFEKWVERNKNFKFVIKEAAILFESGSHKDCNKIITVTAPLETRIQRIIARDKVNREEILARINNQWTDEMRISHSDFVIENIDFELTKQQAAEILDKLKMLV